MNYFLFCLDYYTLFPSHLDASIFNIFDFFFLGGGGLQSITNILKTFFYITIALSDFIFKLILVPFYVTGLFYVTISRVSKRKIDFSNLYKVLYC